MSERPFITSLRPIVALYCVIVMLSVCLRVEANSNGVKIENRPSPNVKNGPSANNAESYDVFVATDEWQVVRKGQPIPRGLHVRINFETGKTEAKKLDPEESKNTAVTLVQEDVNGKLEEKLEASISGINPNPEHDYVKDFMRNMQGNDHREGDVPKDDVVTSTKKTFKTYDELKKDMADMDLQLTTDMEMLAELISKFPTSSLEDRVVVLTDLEYLVHQIDNAMEFARLEGFSLVVYPSFNASDAVVRLAAVRLLGSAVQSNPQVQITALSTGSVQLLLRTLLHDEDANTRSSALYALSCLIRRFPAAQVKMIQEGGLSVLANTFDRKENSKLKIKVVTLLYDLLQEKNSTEATDTESELDLESKLLKSGWCLRIPKLLVAETTNPDNDVVEKVTSAMLALVNVCKDYFESTKVRTNLSQLENFYKELVRVDPDEYFIGLTHLLRNLSIQLKPINGEL